jgi:hypothetical protein
LGGLSRHSQINIELCGVPQGQSHLLVVQASTYSVSVVGSRWRTRGRWIVLSKN